MGGSQGGEWPCGDDTCDSSPPDRRANSRVDRTRRAVYTEALNGCEDPPAGSAIRRPRWAATPPGPLLCATHLWHHLLAVLALARRRSRWHPFALESPHTTMIRSFCQ